MLWTDAAADQAIVAAHPLVVCLDLQRDRTAAPPSNDTLQRITACQRILAHARQCNWPLIHVLRGEEGGGVGPGDLMGPIDGLQPRPFETVLLRTGLSAFSDRRFNDLVAGARGQVVLMGVALGPACLATAFDAHDHGIEVTLVEDTLSVEAVRGLEPDTVRAVLQGVAGPFIRWTTSARMLRLGPPDPVRPAANDL
jgi:nicotinamidase-related amidase